MAHGGVIGVRGRPEEGTRKRWTVRRGRRARGGFRLRGQGASSSGVGGPRAVLPSPRAQATSQGTEAGAADDRR